MVPFNSFRPRALRELGSSSPSPHCPPVTPSFYCLFQKLSGRRLNPTLRMFGQSISGGIDMDGNGYPGKLFFSKPCQIKEDRCVR